MAEWRLIDCAFKSSLLRVDRLTGKHILLLERRDFLPFQQENWDARTVFGENKYTKRGLFMAG